MMKQTVISTKEDSIKEIQSESQIKEKGIRHRRGEDGRANHAFFNFCPRTLGLKFKDYPGSPKRAHSVSLRIQRRFNYCMLNLCVLGRIIYRGFCFVWVFNGPAPAVHLGTDHSFHQQRVCSNPFGSFPPPGRIE